MIKNGDWIENEGAMLNTRKCVVYYRDEVGSKVWSQLCSSVSTLDARVNVSGKNAKAIAFISKSLIMVI